MKEVQRKPDMKKLGSLPMKNILVADVELSAFVEGELKDVITVPLFKSDKPIYSVHDASQKDKDELF